MKNVQYVVQLIDHHKTQSELMMILERGKRGNLLKLIKTEPYFQEIQNIFIFWSKLVRAVQGIHEKNYSHSDLKLENIVVTDDFSPIVIDFDLAVRLNSVDHTRGTRSYMAPEILKAMSYGNMLIYKEGIDVYALGVIFYAMVKKVFPVALNGFGYNQLKNSKIRYSAGDNADFVELTSHMITNLERRMSLEDVRESIARIRLKHNYNTISAPILVDLLPPVSIKFHSDTASKDNYEMVESPSFKRKQNGENTFNSVEMIVILSLALLMIGGIVLLIYFSRSSNEKIMANSFSYGGDSSFNHKDDSMVTTDLSGIKN